MMKLLLLATLLLLSPSLAYGLVVPQADANNHLNPYEQPIIANASDSCLTGRDCHPMPLLDGDPDCDQILTDSIGSWGSLTQSLTVMCLTIGDYSGLGKLTIATSGTNGTRKWLVCVNFDGSRASIPVGVTLANRCKIKRFSMTGKSFWIFDRLDIDADGDGTNIESILMLEFASDNIVNESLVEDGGDVTGMVLIKNDSDRNIFQYNVIRDTKITQDRDNECSSVVNSDDNIFVNNEVYNCNKPFSNKNSIGNPHGGNVWHNNDAYNEPSRFTDCNGNFTPGDPDSPCSVGEAMISFKGGGNQAKPLRFTQNRGWGFRRSDGICCAASAFGQMVSLTEETGKAADYVEVRNNILGESQSCITSAREGPNNNSIIGNICYDIKQYNTDNPSSALSMNRNASSEWYLNTVLNSAGGWINSGTSSTNSDIRCNVAINSGAASGGIAGNLIIDDNVFYGTPKITANGGDRNIGNLPLILRTNSLPLFIDDVVWLTTTAPRDGTSGDVLFRVTTAGTTASSPPAYPATAGQSVNDGSAVLVAVRVAYSFRRKLLTVPGGEEKFLPYAARHTLAQETGFCVGIGLGSRPNIGIHDVQAGF